MYEDSRIFFLRFYNDKNHRHSDVTYNHENELDQKPMEGCFDFGITKPYGAWYNNNVFYYYIFKIILPI